MSNVVDVRKSVQQNRSLIFDCLDAYIDIYEHYASGDSKNFVEMNLPGYTVRRKFDGLVFGNKAFFAAAFQQDNSNNYLIVFRGTVDKAEWINDLRIAEVLFRPYASPAEYIGADLNVAAGFYDLYISMRDEIFDFIRYIEGPVDKIVFSGHSLGSSLATYCAFDYMLAKRILQLKGDKQLVVLTGAPRAITPPLYNNYVAQCQEYGVQSLNIANINDCVTFLPKDRFVQMPYIFPINFLAPDSNYWHHNARYYRAAFDKATRGA